MKNYPKTTIFMATSADGFIARENGEEDFLSHDGWLHMLNFVKEYGHLIWGRKTYEIVMGWGDEYIDALDDYPVILVSRSNKVYPKKNVMVCNSPKSSLENVLELGFERVFLSGGPSLNASFINAGLVEEIIISYNPVFIGNGKPFISDLETDLKVDVIKHELLANNIISVRYSIV